jgi:hypothetical protein
VGLIVYYVAFMVVGDAVAYFAWAFHRVRVGVICEPHRLSRPLFSFSVAVLAARRVGYQTKINTAGRVVGRAAGAVARAEALRDDTFEAHLAGVPGYDVAGMLDVLVAGGRAAPLA